MATADNLLVVFVFEKMSFAQEKIQFKKLNSFKNGQNQWYFENQILTDMTSVKFF